MGEIGMRGEFDTLDGLYRRISPYWLMNRIQEAIFVPTAHEFSVYADRIFPEVRRTDVASVLRGDGAPPLYLLSSFGKRVLSKRNEEIVYKFDMIFHWRNVSLFLGQDLVVTAWLATLPCAPASFSWSSSIPTDCGRLNAIMDRGIAENHCHLYGSAAIFSLNWSRAMSWPVPESEAWSNFEIPLQYHLLENPDRTRWSASLCLSYAAFLRGTLFRKLQGEAICCMDALRAFDAMDARDKTESLLSLTALIRRKYGEPFRQPDGTVFCLDYAFTKELSSNLSSGNRIRIGERNFLYRCFRHSFSGAFDLETQWLFYLYLLLKENFRGELIHVNQVKGLSNFQDYGRRKFSFWTMPDSQAYWNEAIRTAIIAPLQEQPISSLELRLSPFDSPKEMLERIEIIDRMSSFYAQESKQTGRLCLISDGRKKWLSNTFYVLHFLRRKDDNVKCLTGQTKPRHYNLRTHVFARAIMLDTALRQYPYLRYRIRGIDACSNELDCPPEVFAVPFRFLLRADSGTLPQLSLTYHVGEDFIDIPDGLRAIDETLQFLNPPSGARIAHALALGINPKLYYEKKKFQITSTKQRLLDTTVWLIFRSVEFSVHINAKLLREMEERAKTLISELFGGDLKNITLRDYYESWMLRGDNPLIYRSELSDDEAESNALSPFFLNPSKKAGDCRQNPKAIKLYYDYHYSEQVKKEGEKQTLLLVSKDYIVLVRNMQRKMQDRLANKKIGVECTPSMDVLISLLPDYEKHPVFRFYPPDEKYRKFSSELCASINTDDSGLIDTSLAFEYALIAATLALKKNRLGNRVYAWSEVEQYVDSLRIMGHTQVFNKHNVIR